MKISILCPTRNRLGNMGKMIKSAFDMAYCQADIEIIFYIDIDDYPSKELLGYRYMSDQIKRVPDAMVKQTKSYNDTWNQCYKISSGEIIMIGSDDIEFKTKNWDKLVIDTFDIYEDKILFVIGDNSKGNYWKPHGFLHKKWIDTLGYIFPPDNKYGNYGINYIADSLGRKISITNLNFGDGREITYHLIDISTKLDGDKLQDIINKNKCNWIPNGLA